MEGNAKVNEAIQVLKGKIKSIPQIDNTLTKEGCAADAKMVGDRLKAVSPEYAKNIIYDNASSKLEATDLQGAVDELCGDYSEVGVEYKTAERFAGKPVYYKRLSVGALPHNDVKWTGHGITNMGYVVDFGGVSAQGDFAKVLSLPYCLNSSYYGHLSITHENVVIATSGISAEEAAAYFHTVVWIKYTKTTD